MTLILSTFGVIAVAAMPLLLLYERLAIWDIRSMADERTLRRMGRPRIVHSSSRPTAIFCLVVAAVFAIPIYMLARPDLRWFVIGGFLIAVLLFMGFHYKSGDTEKRRGTERLPRENEGDR